MHFWNFWQAVKVPSVDIKEWMNYDPYLGRATPNSAAPPQEETREEDEVEEPEPS